MAVESPNAETAEAPASRGRRLNQLLFLLALTPMAAVAGIIHRYGVNVPFGDEWSVLTLIEKCTQHQLSFADLYQEHNGHRILLPRLFFLCLAQLTHGNMRAEMFCSLFVCVLTSAGFYLLLRRTVSGSTTQLLLLWALINLFLFSPIQAENWLWGFQLQIFLSNLCLVGAVVSITSDASVLWRLAGAAVFAIAGTLSFGNGLLIWPLVFFLLVCRKEKPLFLAVWAGLAALAALAYLPGYQGHEPVRPATGWLEYPLYFAGFLGAPLARIPNSHPLILPVTIGSLMVATYLGLGYYSFRRRDVVRNAAPWLALGAYAIGSAALAARARIHLGPLHALDSRYTTVSVFLTLSLIGLAAALFSEAWKSTSWPAPGKVALATALISLLTLYLINLPYEFNYLWLHHGFRTRGKAALEFSKVVNLTGMLRSTLLLTEEPETSGRYLELLDRLQFSNPPRRETAVLKDGDQPKHTPEEHGVFEDLKFKSANSLGASGWASISGDDWLTACVVLAYRRGEEWVAFALSDAAQRRPDLVAKYKKQSYVNRGWQSTFSRSVLPPGSQEISAWALDVDRGETYRLPGSFVLPE